MKSELSATEHRKTARICWVFAISLAVMAITQLFAYRFDYYMQDAVSYLDMADHFKQGDFASGFTAYWSPLYPIVIAVVTSIVRLPPYWEPAQLHMTNLVVLIFVLFCFRAFLSSFLIFYARSFRKSQSVFARIPRHLWMLLLCSLFLYYFPALTGIETDTPDLLAHGLLFLAMSRALAIQAGSNKTKDFVILGITLGVAYYAKSVMFPLSLFLYVSLLLRNTLGRLPKLIMALAITTFISLPLMVAVSRAEGAVTFSPTAKLNYYWMVQQGLTPPHATGDDEERQHLLHPTRKIFSQPDAYEFRYEQSCTYPPHFDPSYWYRGARVQLMPDRLLSVYSLNMIALIELFIAPLAMLCVFLAFIYKRKYLTTDSVLFNAPLFLISLVTCFGTPLAVFIIFEHTNRYFQSACLLIFVGFFSSLRLNATEIGNKALRWTTILMCIFCIGNAIVREVGDVVKALSPASYPYAEVMKDLQAAGLHGGDNVARLGDKEMEVWARQCRLHVVADIPEPTQFWSATPERRAALIDELKKYNVKALVYFSQGVSYSQSDLDGHYFQRLKQLGLKKGSSPEPEPEFMIKEGWKKIDDLHGYYLAL